jgi:hypothetical protein
MPGKRISAIAIGKNNAARRLVGPRGFTALFAQTIFLLSFFISNSLFAQPAVQGGYGYSGEAAIACAASSSKHCAATHNISHLQSGTFTLPRLTGGQFYEITVIATSTTKEI